jgi:hypothetical protein
VEPVDAASAISFNVLSKDKIEEQQKTAVRLSVHKQQAQHCDTDLD